MKRRRHDGQGNGPRRKSVAPALRTVDTPVIRRFRRGFRWDRVELEPYKLGTHRAGEFAGASRQVIAGNRGEPLAFELRYFELAPGGFTSLERHRHCHVVVCVRGCGRAQVAGRVHRVAPFDTVYIGPDQPHRLEAAGRAPFGFFCIVDKRRDKPRPPPRSGSYRPAGVAVFEKLAEPG